MIGIVPGQFDPPNFGDVALIMNACLSGEFRKILILPEANKDWTSLAPKSQRIDMLNILFSDIPEIEVLDIEKTGKLKDSLDLLGMSYNPWDLKLIMTVDDFIKLPEVYKGEEIISDYRFRLYKTQEPNSYRKYLEAKGCLTDGDEQCQEYDFPYRIDPKTIYQLLGEGKPTLPWIDVRVQEYITAHKINYVLDNK